MRYFGYARVSSKDQNLSRQLDSLKGLGKPNMVIFQDVCSGKDFNRPEYKKMTDMLMDGDVVYICSLDRLGRNYVEIQEEWAKITKIKKAVISVLDMPLLNTDNPKDTIQSLISDIVLQILAFVAENERENIRARQAEGIACAKKKGVRFGRPQKKIPLNILDIVKKYEKREISMSELLLQCNISRSTYYRRIKGSGLIEYETKED